MEKQQKPLDSWLKIVIIIHFYIKILYLLFDFDYMEKQSQQEKQNLINWLKLNIFQITDIDISGLCLSSGFADSSSDYWSSDTSKDKIVSDSRYHIDDWSQIESNLI